MFSLVELTGRDRALCISEKEKNPVANRQHSILTQQSTLRQEGREHLCLNIDACIRKAAPPRCEERKRQSNC